MPSKAKEKEKARAPGKARKGGAEAEAEVVKAEGEMAKAEVRAMEKLMAEAKATARTTSTTALFSPRRADVAINYQHDVTGHSQRDYAEDTPAAAPFADNTTSSILPP